MAMQQVIAASQITLQDKMEKFLEFLEQQSKNNFTQLSPPHKRHSTTDMMYLQQHTGIFLQHTALPRKLVITGITVSVKCNNAGLFSHT